MNRSTTFILQIFNQLKIKMMKKIIFGLTTIFIASQLLVSCGSESAVLSQFSKRKYLKKYKKEKVEDENNINEYYYTASNTEELNISEVLMEEVSEIDNSEVIITEEKEIQLKPILTKDYSSWNTYNRKVDFSNMDFNELKMVDKHQEVAGKKVNDVVLVILSIFLPPLAVYLYEDSITTNFWVDLILTLFFWIPGMIFAFLVCFAGMSL